jgi:hypothetical protein
MHTVLACADPPAFLATPVHVQIPLPVPHLLDLICHITIFLLTLGNAKYLTALLPSTARCGAPPLPVNRSTTRLLPYSYTPFFFFSGKTLSVPTQSKPRSLPCTHTAAKPRSVAPFSTSLPQSLFSHSLRATYLSSSPSLFSTRSKGKYLPPASCRRIFRVLGCRTTSSPSLFFLRSWRSVF